MASQKIKKYRNDYTVGWLAALSCEMAAAEMMLNNVHDRPDDFQQQKNDQNSYVWGEIAGHNIVIASLSCGQSGIASATSSALSMAFSFPKIRFVLMVGIGGGIPHEDGPNIRLGDVVVGKAVYQYDHGGITTDTSSENRITTDILWEDKSHLNKPPPLLLRALTNIDSKLKRGISQVSVFMNEATKELPSKNRKNFMHPDSKCDETKLTDLGKHEDLKPEIHIGNIASGNIVVKDASFRDSLSERVGAKCLCCEMEAAGLMNDVPCMVIRGICDNADMQKNDKWQQYAAMTAAAFAKDLLFYVFSEDVASMPEARDVMCALIAIQKDIKQRERRDQENIIRNWLKPCEPSENHNRARKSHLSGTGSWFLESDRYARWKKNEIPSIWLHGGSGCGKTILSSTVIENLKLAGLTVLYYYFDFNKPEKTIFENMLRTLIFQLYNKSETSQKKLEELRSSFRNGTEQPPTEELEAVLQNMIKDSHQVYIVLDALDECRLGDDFSAWLGEKGGARHLNILFTSQKNYDIESCFEKWMPSENRLAIQSEVVDKDIRKLVRYKIQEDGKLARWKQRKDILAQIEDELTRKAQGMFRWVICQLDTLRECHDQPSLLKALRELPKGLNKTYARMLKVIPDSSKPNAIRLLQFLTFSRRPLTLAEAVDALAVNLEETPHFNEDCRMPIPEEITTYCSSLIAMVSRKSWQGSVTELQLAHSSVRTYLVSQHLDNDIKHDFNEIHVKSCIVQVSLAYLIEAFQRQLKTTQHAPLPFKDFAARNWIDHTKAAEKDKAALKWVERLFMSKHFYSWLRMVYESEHRSRMNYESKGYESEGYESEDHESEYMLRMDHRSGDTWSETSPLYQTLLMGMTKLAKILIDKGVDVNAKGGYEGKDTALCIALDAGYVDIVELMLDRDVDVNAKGGEDGNETALCIALESGNIDIVKMLLDRGADVNAKGGRNGHDNTALCIALESGNIDIVKMLLGRGADVNAKSGYDDDSKTALCIALDAGYIDIVKMLLDQNADINAKSGQDGNETALRAASRNGHTDIVRLLLNKGAHTDKLYEYEVTAINAASRNGHLEVVQLLLDRGVDISEPDNEGRTPLNLASSNGHLEVVRLLLDRGASVDISKTDDDGRTPLSWASSKGHLEIVRLLLDRGADISEPDNGGWTPLNSASIKGHLEIVRLLLDRGASVDVNKATNDGRTPLKNALNKNHQKVALLLRDKGADPNVKAGDGSSGSTSEEVKSKEAVYAVAPSLCHPPQIRNYRPKPADIICVSNFLDKKGLPERLIDAILEQAEYWARITTTLDTSSGEDYTAYGNYRQDVLILRSKPICSAAADGAFDEFSSVQSITSTEPGLISVSTDLMQNHGEESIVSVREPRDRHPVRRITWTITSHDQGFASGGKTFRNGYEESWTGFRGDVLRYVPPEMSFSRDACPQYSDRTGEAEFWQFSSREYLSAWNDIQVPVKRAREGDLGQYTEETTDELRVWPRKDWLFKRSKLQANQRAGRKAKEHIIIWDARDCVTTDELAKKGRGIETGSGKQVEALCRGDVVELHSFAFFPGWRSHVKSAKLVIEFAM